MPSNHLILCHPLLLLPSIFPSIRVFSNESAFCIRWPKYWSFSSSISPSNEYLQRKHMPNHRVVGFKYLKFFFKIYLFNFDCAGSRCIAFLQVAPGASPHCGAQAFHRAGCEGRRFPRLLLESTGSRRADLSVVASRLQGAGLVVLAGTWQLHSVWDLPRPRICHLH